MQRNTPAVPATAAGLDPSADRVMMAAAEAAEPLDAILRQIIGGYFVLTDGQGSVSKWSEPAELLFGRPAAEVLGQSFFQTLIQTPAPAAAESWRGFLETGEAPRAAGRVEVSALHADGTTFEMETVFVPVKLDEGFDFSLFLEDLGFQLPMNLMQQRMRAQHPIVVRALRQAMEPEPQPWEGWRTAGTLVVFRPLAPTPWVEAALAAREAARAEADADVEERLTNLDPGVQGSVADLDDAAAVVARLLSAMERIDELERVALSLPGQLEEARLAGERRAEAAEREAQALRDEIQRALAGGTASAGVVDETQHRELLARLERLERARMDAEQAAHDRGRALDVAEAARAELATRLDRLERQRAESSAAADARLATAVAEAQRRAEEAILEAGRRADESRAEVETRLAEIESGHSSAGDVRQSDLIVQLEQVRAEHEEAAQTARAELSETLERLERDRAREAEAARADLAAALQRVEHVQREADALREQLTAVTVERAEAGEDRRRLDELARDAEAARARMEAMRGELAPLRDGAAALEALRAEIASLREAQSAPAELHELRSELSALQTRAADVASLGERLDALQVATSGIETLHSRLDEATSSADLDALRAELAALREDADVSSLRSDIAVLRAGAGEVESLRSELATVRERAADAAALDELRGQQDELRGWLEEARRERDEFRAAEERTSSQVIELRSLLDLRESNPSIPVDQVVERHVVEAMGGEVEALRHAERALRTRLAELATAGEAATRRIDELTAEGDAVARRVEEVVDTTAARLEELAAAADTATTAAVDARAEAAHAVDKAERIGELDTLSDRLDELASARAAADARIEEAAAQAAAAAEDAAAARQAGHAVHELEERLNEVDRGAGAVLADVRGVRDRLDELSTVARAAQEAAAGNRTDAEELRAAIARVTGEVEAARSQVEHASHEALGAREQAAAAGAAATAARDDAGRAREEAGAIRRELDAGEEKVTALGAEVERATAAAGTAAAAAEAAQADAAAARTAGERTAERLAEIDAKAESLRTETTASRDRLEALTDRLERLGKDVVEAGQATGTAIEAQGTELRAELAAARRLAEEARDTVDTVRADIEAVREQSLSARDDAAGARAAAESGDRRVEAMQAELTYALKTLEEVKAGLTSAGQAAVIARREAEQAKRAAQTAGDGNSGVHEVFQQLLAAARGGGPLAADGAKLGRPSTPASDLRRKTESAAREPRHGFDDVAQPLAILGLDGRFRELNPAFARLVGYQEQAFAKAAWPSPHDRAGYQQSQEELRQLASGEIDSVAVQSTYMHGQGLMVPVVGTLKVVPGEDGLPVHLLLEAEERHTG